MGHFLGLGSIDLLAYIRLRVDGELELVIQALTYLGRCL